MNPGELLAHVTAKAAPLERSISSFDRLSPEDILHSLGLIQHPGAVLLLRVKFCQQTEYLQDLDIRFWMAIGDLAQREKWPYPIKLKGRQFYRNCGRMALSEHISPHICLACAGNSGMILNNKWISCPECSGTGRKRPSESRRARFVGMPFETWRRGWNDRYKRILEIADIWEGIGIGAMKKRLSAA